MRTLLHAPRTRKRSIAAATLGALALVGSLLVATPAQAINDTGTGGVFVPASGRVLDTKAGTGGFTTPMEAGKYRTIKIAGVAGIPDDGTVGAVSLNATVSGTPSAGTLFGRPDADTSRTTMLIYNANTGEYVSNTAIVAVSAAGTIQVSTETAARLILDVQGYYTANTDGTAAGGFVPVAGKRIVDTRSGLGAPKALLAPGKSVDIQVTGTNGVPAGASGAVVNLLPINSTASDGYLTPYATGTTRPDNALHYAPSVNTSIQAQVRLSSSGKMTIYNGSSTINLVIDLQGYFTAAGTTGATFTPGVGRVFDSRSSGSSILAKDETRAIPIAGQAGVPVMGSGITAVVLTLTAAHGGSEGRASVWPNGATQPETTSINFQTDEIRTNTVTVALGANGKINLNNVAAATNYVIDVQGWYTNPISPSIACAAPYSSGSWTRTVPADDILCSVGVPAASSSNQDYDLIVDDVAYDTVSAQSATSSVAVTVGAFPGSHTISVALAGQILNSYTFTLGQWELANAVPSPESGSTATADTELSVAPSGDEVYPDDASFAYTIWADQTGSRVVASSGPQSGPWTPPAGSLETDTTYYWSVAVTGTTSTGRQTAQSPVWPIKIHNLTADELSAPTFQYTDGDDLQAVVQSGLDGSNSTQVANILDGLATSAGEGKDVGLPVLADQTPAAASEALSAQADAVRSGELTSDTPDATDGAGRSAARSSTPEWDSHIGGTSQLGSPVAHKRSWEAISYVHGYQCHAGLFGSICDEKDKWRVKAIIDPGIKGAAVTLYGSRQLAERNIIGSATFEWQAFRLRTVNGHKPAVTVPTKSKRFGMEYYQNVKKFDSTFWFRLGGTKKGIKKGSAHTDTAYCGTEDCKWD